jgi:hypothetical protein
MLSFATDCWTSPNHKAFMAITVHFLVGREKKSVILDLVELPCSHTGDNMSTVFAKVLEDFGITHKVSTNQRGG